MEKRLNLRFNLNRESDRRAWEYLRNQSVSMNKAVISAINSCIDHELQSDKEQALIDRIAEAVRTELHSAPAFTLSQLLQPQAIPLQQAENISEEDQSEAEENILDFWDSF